MRITEILTEDANLKRQAAIAIAMKKAGKKPKNMHEEDEGMFGRSKNDKRYLDKFDPTEVMNISDDPSKAHKTTGKGSLRTSKEDLEFAFGPPGEDDTWVLEFGNGLIATIYPQSNSGGMDWIIGGNHPDTEDFVHMAYSAALDDELEEGENWSKYNHKRVGGMSKKSVSSYRRSHPGSKIQTAVTTKPSKLKKGSKAAKRRASFCARMRGMKKHRTGAKTAHDPNSNINKSLRRWHCESIEELHELVMLAEQFIRNKKNEL